MLYTPGERITGEYSFLSALDATGRHALDDVVLTENVGNHRGDDGDHGAGKDLAVVHDVARDKLRHADLHRAHGGLRRDQQGPEVGVVDAHEQVHRQRRQRRQRQRQRDAEQKADIAAAVERSRFLEVLRQRQEVLTHHEDGRTADEGGNNQAEIGVRQAEVLHRDEVRDHDDLAGDHHAREHKAEQELLALELKGTRNRRPRDSPR